MKCSVLKSIRTASWLVALAFFPTSRIDAQSYPITAVEIPAQSGALPVPAFIGEPAIPKAIRAMAIPSNPFQAPAPWSVIHNDTYMSDTYRCPGPLGRFPSAMSTWLGTVKDPFALTVGITFDSHGYLVAAAITADTETLIATVKLTLIDPNTLATLAQISLPPDQLESPSDRPSGVYFYTDELDRIVVGTVERTIWIVSHAQTATGWEFSHDITYDLSSTIPPSDGIQALQPDFAGRIWVTSKGGVVATLDAHTGYIYGVSHDLRNLGERVLNGHAVDEENGMFVASSNAMYRFDADIFARPCITWRAVYGTGDRIKPGQIDLGTGTTPTLMGKEYVTITDNDDPYMHVLVYRRAKYVSGNRLVCAVPVFKPYKGCTENSLVATDRSIIVENNYGYRSTSQDTTNGRTTMPGITRIDLDRNGRARKVWTSYTDSIPSAVTKMSLRNGLIYSYTKPKGPGTTDCWYFTAIDFRTGKTVWKRLAGTGILYDNNYASIYLGPNGVLYQGVNGGVVAMRDTQ